MSLVNQWDSDFEPLQVNDDTKDENSSTEHTQIWVVGSCESLINSIRCGRFGHNEMYKANETSLEFYSVF